MESVIFSSFNCIYSCNVSGKIFIRQGMDFPRADIAELIANMKAVKHVKNAPFVFLRVLPSSMMTDLVQRYYASKCPGILAKSCCTGTPTFSCILIY